MLGKVIRLALTRPMQFWAMVRQEWLFACTRLLGRLFFTRGIELGRRARIQRLRCLSAERPSARIHVGAHTIVYEHARIEAYGTGEIVIGEASIIGDARIYARGRLRLGKRVVTSWNVFIQDFDPHPIDPKLRAVQMIRMTGAQWPLPKLDWQFAISEVSIGDDVWLGANVTVLKGARIGDGCVVATGSVVTAGEYPARSILAGVPAKVVKQL